MTVRKVLLVLFCIHAQSLLSAEPEEPKKAKVEKQTRQQQIALLRGTPAAGRGRGLGIRRHGRGGGRVGGRCGTFRPVDIRNK